MEDYYSIDEIFESDLLTNFRKEEMPIYESAIADWEKESPENKGLIYIKKKAYCRKGLLIDHCSALHIDGDRRDLSDFWEIFDYYKLQPRFLAIQTRYWQDVIIGAAESRLKYKSGPEQLRHEVLVKMARAWYNNQVKKSRSL